MSVVLTYANEDIAIISSDGRVIDLNNNSIISENFSKIRKINKNVIVGFSGHAIPCQMIVDSIINSEKEIENFYVENATLSIERKISSMPKMLNMSFSVCGIGKNNKICAAIVSTYHETQFNYPSGDTISYYEFYPHEIPKNTDFYVRMLQTRNPLDAMSETIKYCSKLSPSVNDVMSYECIRID